MPEMLSEDEKLYFLDCYNPEFRGEGNGLFRDLFRDCCNGKQIEVKDVVLIYRWKLGRILDRDVETINNNIGTFKNAIISAKQDGGEIAAIETLTGIRGCGHAVASAILSVFCPDKFSIIDKRVLSELGYTDKPETYKWTAQTYWKEFIPKIREFAEANRVDLRTADKILWGKSLSRQILVIN